MECDEGSMLDNRGCIEVTDGVRPLYDTLIVLLQGLYGDDKLRVAYGCLCALLVFDLLVDDLVKLIPKSGPSTPKEQGDHDKIRVHLFVSWDEMK